MPIESTDFVWRRSALTSDATPSSNGGRMSSTAITSGARGVLFPDVTEAQRTTGATHHRKAFIHVASSATIELLDAKIFISQATPGDDFVTLHKGTQTDVQSTLTERAYGAAALNAPASAGASSIQITPDGLADLGALAPFQAGDLIRIANGANVEYHTIGTVTDNTTYLTLALDGSVLDGAFAVSGTVVSSVIEVASTVASISNVVPTTTSGTIDGAALVAGNKGAVLDTITLTFTSATNYTAEGVILGSLGTGSVSSTFSPNNPGVSAPYFSIPSVAWTGTWANGETVVFDLAPASIPLWYRRQVPAGAGSLADNDVVVGISGESAA